MADYSLPEGEIFRLQMIETMKNNISKNLKEPLMKLAEQEVDNAVKNAIDSLNINTRMYNDVYRSKSVIEVLLLDKRADG